MNANDHFAEGNSGFHKSLDTYPTHTQAHVSAHKCSAPFSLALPDKLKIARGEEHRASHAEWNVVLEREQQPVGELGANGSQSKDPINLHESGVTIALTVLGVC